MPHPNYDKNIAITLTWDEFEYVLYEILQSHFERSTPSVALDTMSIITDWKEQASKQGWAEEAITGEGQC